MSSKKIYTTVGIEEAVLDRLKHEAKQEQRSVGFIVEKILRIHFQLPRIEQGEKQHAD